VRPGVQQTPLVLKPQDAPATPTPGQANPPGEAPKVIVTPAPAPAPAK
jgi:hypothetical protein